jgi:hypothetical protein
MDVERVFEEYLVGTMVVLSLLFRSIRRLEGVIVDMPLLLGRQLGEVLVQRPESIGRDVFVDLASAPTRGTYSLSQVRCNALGSS